MTTKNEFDFEYKVQYQEINNNKPGCLETVSFNHTSIESGKNWWTGYDLDCLFPFFIMRTPYDNFFKIEDLRCKITNPLTMDSCIHKNTSEKRSKNYQKCWCSLIQQIIENGSGNTVFILRNMHGHGIIMNIYGTIHRKCKYNHSTPEIRLTNWRFLETYIEACYSYITVDEEQISLNLYHYPNSRGRIVTIVDKTYYPQLWDNTINFTSKFLPEKFVVTHKNLMYVFTKSNCLISYELHYKDECDEDIENCWCDELNSIRSTGECLSEVVMSPCKSSHNPYPGIARFFIKRNESDPSLLDIRVRFIFNDSKYRFKQNLRFKPQLYNRYNYGSDTDEYEESDDDGSSFHPNLFSNRTDDF